MTPQEKIPYYTRMMLGGLALFVIGLVGHDLFQLHNLSAGLTAFGAIFSFVGFIGRLCYISDA